MNKKIFIIEDRVFTLDGILDSIQAIMLKAYMTDAISVSNGETLQFYVLQIVDKDRRDAQIKADEGTFQMLKNKEEDLCSQLIEKRPDLATKIPVVEYQYECIDLSTLNPADYLKNSVGIAGRIQTKIDELLSGSSDYLIMLDIILLEEPELKMDLKKDKIVSQLLYENNRDHCIPYTHYGENQSVYRNDWQKGVRMTKELMERSCIKGGKIYIPLKNDVYQCFNIKVK